MKKTAKKYTLSVLAAVFSLSLTAGIGASGLLQVNAESEANYWTMTGVDGYTVEHVGDGWRTTANISENADTVTWSLNGGVKAPITWSNAQYWDNNFNKEDGEGYAEAMVITYKSTIDPDKQFSLVATRNSNVYWSLTDDISFDVNNNYKPYVTGTQQNLQGESHVFMGGATAFYVTTAGKIEIRGGETTSFSILDESALALSSQNLPDGELKEKYTTEYVTQLYTVFTENPVTLDIAFYGVNATGTKDTISLKMRSLSDVKYYDDATNGTEKFACYPVLIPKHTALYPSTWQAYNKWDLFEYKAPLEKSSYDLHGFYNIPADKYAAGSKGWGVYGNYVGVSANTFIPNITATEDVMLSVFTLQLKSGITGYRDGLYCYYMPAIIRSATDVIQQAEGHLIIGKTYKINDLFRLTAVSNTPANKIEVGGFIGSTWGSGSYVNMGTMAGTESWSFTPDATISEYTLCVRPVDKILNGYNGGNSPDETNGMTFTWGVQEDTTPPVISVGDYTNEYYDGDDVTLLAATVTDNSGETLTASVTVTKGGANVEVTENKIAVTAGTYTVSYTARDSAGNESTAEKTITVKPCEVQYASLTLNGDIGLNFYAKLSSKETAPKAEIGFADGTKTQCDGTYADGLWRFTYPVAPKDYKKAVSFALTTNNGAEVSAEYSVETYLNNVTESEAHYTLCVNTKEYCEAARVYFYGKTATATAELEADLSEYAGSVSGEDANVTILGATLVLETKTSVRVYFNAKNAEGLVCTVDGATAEIKQENGFTYLEVADIAVKDLGGMHTFTIGDITVNYGAISYVQSVANVTDNAALDNVVKALYNAFVAGAEYFKAN